MKARDPDDPIRTKEYESPSLYYEEKCDSVLRKKFPITSKIINRIS